MPKAYKLYYKSDWNHIKFDYRISETCVYLLPRIQANNWVNVLLSLVKDKINQYSLQPFA